MKSIYEVCESKKKPRDGEIDALRCLLMFLIVLYHCYVHGICADEHPWWGVLFSTFIIWHVDAFVAISGWYGVSFSLSKYLSLYGQILFYSLLSFVYSFFRGGLSSFTISGGWFGGTYLTLLMIAPLLNVTIKRLCEKSSKEAFYLWGLFALAMFLQWVPRNGFTAVNAMGIDKGYSIMMFVFIYVTVRMIRLKQLQLERFILWIVSLFVVFVLLLSYLTPSLCRFGFERVDYSTYNAPHVWSMAVAFLLIFAKYVKIPARVGCVFSLAAPSIFGVYLLHDVTSFGRKLVLMSQHWMMDHFILHPVVVVFLSAIFIFFAGLAVDMVRRLVVRVGSKCLISCLAGHAVGSTKCNR